MRLRRSGVLLLLAGVVLLSGAALYFRDHWLAWFSPAKEGNPAATTEHDHAPAKRERVELTPQAFANVQPDSRPLALRSYERTIELPGVVVDRPGLSDRGVPAPVSGIVTRIHVEPGLAVRATELLFTIRVTSEYLQNAQAELFKTASEMDLNRKQRKRLADQGVVPEARLIELDQQYARLEAVALAHTQDLLARGLTPEQVTEVRRGELIKEVRVQAPASLPDQKLLAGNGSSGLAYEIQEIKVEIGQQVQAGQVLAFLSNHHSLAIEGRAFASEAALIERTARVGAPIEVEFVGDEPGPWKRSDEPLQNFTIRYVSNMIDPAKRLLLFQLPLINQGEPLMRDGRTFLLWRYRPGQRVRLHVPVEKWEGVLVLPIAAIVKEGAEVYVFRQDGDCFDRKPVRLLYEDRRFAVLDPRGSDVALGQWVAHQGAAILNRALKAQASGGHGHDHDHHHH